MVFSFTYAQRVLLAKVIVGVSVLTGVVLLVLSLTTHSVNPYIALSVFVGSLVLLATLKVGLRERQQQADEPDTASTDFD